MLFANEGHTVPDRLGFRKRIGIVVPSTNTTVQPECEVLRPRGITNHVARSTIKERPLWTFRWASGKVGQAGKEHVIHMRGHHDDLANTIAGVIYRLTPMQPVVCSWGGIGVVSRPRDYHGLYASEADENMAAWLRSQG